MARLVLTLGLLLALAAPAWAQAERRVALIIGNGRYAAVPSLPNPGRDAEAMAQTLRGIGFSSVTLANDLNRERLVEALRTFAVEADRADWAVIYYAGHGIEVAGTNYLVPVDAQLVSDRDVPFETVALPQLLAAVEGAKKLRLIILDACRANPFVPRMQQASASRAIGRGLARVEPSGGVLVAYAARDGQVALDGSGANSPFVASLVHNLATPGLEINRLFRRVRTDVLNATDNRQEPYVYGSLPDEDFYFKAPDGSAPAEAAPRPALPSTPPPPRTASLPQALPETRPALPRVEAPRIESPRLKPKPAPRARPKPEPVVTRPPRRVAQRVRPEPAVPRPRPAAVVRSPSEKCFVFNGQRMCQ